MAKKHKKHKKHDEHVDESWLVPYADILTLLLALFVVLFASSTVDEKKLEQMSAAFNNAFTGGIGILDNTAPVPVQNGTPDSTELVQSYTEDQAALQQLQGRVDEFIAVNELEEQYETKMTEEGLLVTIRDSVLFDPGKATIKDEYVTIAEELSQLLVFDEPRNVVITGHTDNVPMNTAEFRSNWDLSVMRAVNFLKIMVEGNPDLDPKHFSAKGFGEFSPIASNETAEDRAKNRRVEVLIQSRFAQDGTAIPGIE